MKEPRSKEALEEMVGGERAREEKAVGWEVQL